MTRRSAILFALVPALSACTQNWTAAVRFEGGSSAPQVPLLVQVWSSRGELLYKGTLDMHCVTLRFPQQALIDGRVKIDVADANGKHIGALTVKMSDQQLHYIPVDGQPGVVTVWSGKSCK